MELRRWRGLGVVLLLVAAAVGTAAGQGPTQKPAPFAPLEAWRAAVVKNDPAAIQSFYSTQPTPSYLESTGMVVGSADETGFWESVAKSGLTGLSLDLLGNQALEPQLRQIYFQAGLNVNTQRGPQTFYLFVQQTWMLEDGTWRIVGGSRTGLSQLKQPESLDETIYSKTANAHAQIAAAVREAAATHRRVLLEFGGNWCYDCHVLADAFRSSQLAPLLQANYVVVEVDVEEFNYNLDIAAQYQVPLQKGVPALAVLDSHGDLLTSQKNGEFENARQLSPDDLIAFLTRWKPADK